MTIGDAEEGGGGFPSLSLRRSLSVSSRELAASSRREEEERDREREKEKLVRSARWTHQEGLRIAGLRAKGLHNALPRKNRRWPERRTGQEEEGRKEGAGKMTWEEEEEEKQTHSLSLSLLPSSSSSTPLCA